MCSQSFRPAASVLTRSQFLPDMLLSTSTGHDERPALFGGRRRVSQGSHGDPLTGTDLDRNRIFDQVVHGSQELTGGHTSGALRWPPCRPLAASSSRVRSCGYLLVVLVELLVVVHVVGNAGWQGTGLRLHGFLA